MRFSYDKMKIYKKEEKEKEETENHILKVDSLMSLFFLFKII